MSLSLRASQEVESTRAHVNSFSRKNSRLGYVCVLYFVSGIRIGIWSYPFIPKICSDLILISRLGIKRSHVNFRLEF